MKHIITIAVIGFMLFSSCSKDTFHHIVIQGVVTNPSNVPVANATVELFHYPLNKECPTTTRELITSTTTDINGNYRISTNQYTDHLYLYAFISTPGPNSQTGICHISHPSDQTTTINIQL